MRKKVLYILGFALLMAGCGKQVIVENYPTIGSVQQAEETESEPERHVSFTTSDKTGNVIYKVEADVIGNEKEAHPVYEVAYKEFTDEEIEKIANQIFDPGSAVAYIPYWIASAQEKIEYENKIGWISLDGLTEEQSETVSAAISLTEGTISGKNYILYFWRLGEETNVWLYAPTGANGEAAHLFTSVSHFGKQAEDTTKNDTTLSDAEAMARDIFRKMGAKELETILTTSANIFEKQNLGENVEYYEDENKEGALFLFSPIINGQARVYCTQSDDLHGECYVNRMMYNPLVIYSMLLRGEEKDTASMLESQAGWLPGESFLACISEGEILECVWAGPLEIKQTITKKADLMEFRKIQDCFMQYVMANADSIREYSSYGSKTIDRIELSMCMICNEDGMYQIIPAWYFFKKNTSLSSERSAAVCINAIDGSAIEMGSLQRSAVF